ncbi:MAG TPA: RDD family protein [Malonomonas sp.]
MRCPKCGYNSFDHLNSCKKCGKELLEYKQRYGIKSVLFPGQMKPPMAAGAEADSTVVDAAVAAATVAVAGSAAAGAVSETFSAEAPSSEADDFGFDFMGESEEEEDLSFDELFDEAPVDEDVEETLPGPKPAAAAKAEAEDIAEFSFDSAAEDEPVAEAVPAEAELDNDFGFDLDDAVKPETGAGPADDLAPDDFELPPADEEGFDFNTDEIEFGELEEDAETEGDPKDPFELPESPQDEGAPEQDRFFLTDQPIPPTEVDAELQLDEPDVEAAALSDRDTAEREDLSRAFIFKENGPWQSTSVEFQDPEPAADPFEADESFEDLALAEESGAAPEVVAESVLDPEPVVAVEPVDAAEPEIASASVEEVSAAREAEPAAAVEPEVEGFVAAAGAAAVTAVPDEVTVQAVDQTGSPQDSSLLPPLASRVVAFFCDLVLLSAVSLSFIVAAETAMSGSSERLLPSLATLIDLSIPYFLVLFSLAFGYFTLFHFLVGQTPGKMLAGLRVETLDGEPLVFSQAFLRSVGGLLQVLPVGLGYLVAFLSPDRRGWNDRLAGTRLISLKGSLDA